MITVKPGTRDDILELHINSPVTDSDYENVLMPAFDAAIAKADHVRLLIVSDVGIGDFTLGALWDDARMGISRWSGFERAAFVTSNTAMSRLVRSFSIFMPCPVAVFSPDEEDDARRWLTELLGAIHQSDLGNGALHVQLRGKVGSGVYETEAQDLDAFIRRNNRFRLLLDLRDFDGWQGLSAVAGHFRLVRDHVGQLDKAAIVGDHKWQKVISEIGARIIGKEARYFDASQFDDAKAWITD